MFVESRPSPPRLGGRTARVQAAAHRGSGRARLGRGTHAPPLGGSMAAFTRPVLALIVCLSLCGCVDLPRVEAFRSDAATLSRDWAAQSAAWEKRVAAMTPDDPMRPDAQAALARAKAKEAAADAAVKQVDLVITRAKTPDDPL